MSREDLTTIVSRALTDEDFRRKLLSDVEAALEGYDLSESERKVIDNLSPDAFDQLTMDLEDRQSMSGFWAASPNGAQGCRDASTSSTC